MGSPEPTDRESMIREIRRNYSERRCTDIQQLLSTLSNPIRFRILCALRTQPFTVGDLVAITDSHLSNISQHLKMMWMAGYISKRRDGKQVYYALEDSRIDSAIDQLERMYPTGSYRTAADPWTDGEYDSSRDSVPGHG